MERKWRRDQIQETWAQEQWNEMYHKAESGESTDEIENFNELYDTVKHADDQDVKDWNEAQKTNN